MNSAVSGSRPSSGLYPASVKNRFRETESRFILGLRNPYIHHSKTTRKRPPYSVPRCARYPHYRDLPQRPRPSTAPQQRFIQTVIKTQADNSVETRPRTWKPGSQQVPRCTYYSRRRPPRPPSPIKTIQRDHIGVQRTRRSYTIPRDEKGRIIGDKFFNVPRCALLSR